MKKKHNEIFKAAMVAIQLAKPDDPVDPQIVDALVGQYAGKREIIEVLVELAWSYHWYNVVCDQNVAQHLALVKAAEFIRFSRGITEDDRQHDEMQEWLKTHQGGYVGE